MIDKFPLQFDILAEKMSLKKFFLSGNFENSRIYDVYVEFQKCPLNFRYIFLRPDF